MSLKTITLAAVLAATAAVPAFADRDDSYRVRRDEAAVHHERAEIAADKARERNALAHGNFGAYITAERAEHRDERELRADRAKLSRDR